MDRRLIFIILGIVILAVSGCLQSTKGNVTVTATPGVTPVPATATPATPAVTASPTLQATQVPISNNLPPGTLYVTARMLKPAYWGDNSYVLRSLKVEVYNQVNTPLDIKAQIINDGQTLEEKSFSLQRGGSSYQFINDRSHNINGTNVTLRLIVNSYQPVDYPFELVDNLG